MDWVKRNLFFVISGVVALLLLGGAGFYIWKGWDRNATAYNSLTEVVGTLKGLTEQKPSPGNAKVNNTQMAKDQDKEVRSWNEKAIRSFAAIDSIPARDGTNSVSAAAFSSALQKTVDQLRREAEAAGVILPPKCDFSFTAEKDRLTFSAGGLDMLAAQLGEVSAITRVLFAARVNAIDGIQRVRASDDDLTGPVTDYIDQRPVTNDLAVITPWVITFRCFTPELAGALSGFATSTNAFVVKALNVQPASMAGMPGGVVPMMGGEMPQPMPGRTIGGEGYVGYFQPPPPQPGIAPPTAGKGGLQTVLKEQLLRVTMEVNIVKLAPIN